MEKVKHNGHYQNKKPFLGSERSRDHDSEPGVCLALLLISQLVCADDEPLKCKLKANCKAFIH